MIQYNMILSLFSVLKHQWSSQLQYMISVAIINVIWIIWYSRNKIRFQNSSVRIAAARNMVIAAVSTSGKLTGGSMYNSVEELSILHFFKVPGHSSKGPIIKQVNWYPPLCSWFKCNIDGASK